MRKKVLSLSIFIIGIALLLFGFKIGSKQILNKKIIVIMYLAITSIPFYYYIKTFKISKEYIFYSIIYLISFTLLFKPFFSSFFSNPDIAPRELNSFINRNLSMSLYFITPVFLQSSFLLLTDTFKEKLNSFYSKLNVNKLIIYILSFLLGFGVVVVYSPLTVFISSAGDINISLLKLSLNYLIVFAILFSISLFLYYSVPNHRRIVLIVGVFAFSIIVWVYTYLIPGDFGVLDEFVLTKPDSLKVSKFYVIAEVVCLTIAFVFLLNLLMKGKKHIKFLLIVLNLMCLGQFISNIVSSSFIKNKEMVNYNQLENESINQLLNFSRDKNVVIIMLDMFGGGLMQEILSDNQHIYKGLDGFTWFPNTVSASDGTFASMQVLMGGHTYTPDKVLDSGKNMREIQKESHTNYSKVFNGWNISYSGVSFMKDVDFLNKNNIQSNTNKDLHDYYKEIEGDGLGEFVSFNEIRNVFGVIGIFKSVPFFLKSKVYSNSTWMQTNKGGRALKHVVENKSALDILSLKSNVTSSKPTFKFIVNELSHSPWAIDSSGEVSMEYMKTTEIYKFDKELNRYIINDELVKNSAIKSLKLLIEWFDWMRFNDVYDNTKIIIVSDHGYDGIDPMMKDMKILVDNENNFVQFTSRLHPLLLVKDFNESGEVKVSDTFLSNADVPSIAASGLTKEKNIFIDNPIQNPVSNRTLFGSTVLAEEPKNSSNGNMNILGRYSVTENVFDKDNWIYITE